MALKDEYRKTVTDLEAGKRWQVPELKVILRSGGSSKGRARGESGKEASRTMSQKDPSVLKRIWISL